MTPIVSQIVVVVVNRELSDGSVNWPYVYTGVEISSNGKFREFQNWCDRYEFRTVSQTENLFKYHKQFCHKLTAYLFVCCFFLKENEVFVYLCETIENSASG